MEEQLKTGENHKLERWVFTLSEEFQLGHESTMTFTGSPDQSFVVDTVMSNMPVEDMVEIVELQVNATILLRKTDAHGTWKPNPKFQLEKDCFVRIRAKYNGSVPEGLIRDAMTRFTVSFRGEALRVV